MGLRVQLFGRFDAAHGDAPSMPIEWPRKQTQQLFKILVGQRGVTFSQDQLIELLFPKLEPQSAIRNLHKRISELRSALEPTRPKGQASKYIESPSQGSYRFSDSADCDLDVERFEALLSDARVNTKNNKIEAALDNYQEAFKIYLSEYLVEDLYEEWSLTLRQHWRNRYLESLMGAADAALQLGKSSLAIELSEKFISEAPGREEPYGLKMKAYYFSGESQKAIAAFEQCERALKVELGLTPSPEIQDIYVQILNGTLTKPRPAVPNNLPEPLTRFVGRRDEMREIHQRFDQGGCRLLTILGHGGIGKSRLALQIAVDRLGHYSDGGFWVELAPTNDEAQIIYAIGSAIGLKFGGRESPLEQLLEHLGSRNMMLVLDNFEHLIDHARLVHQLLERAPTLHILTSSREPLNLLGEHLFDLEGLSIPPRLPPDVDTSDLPNTYSSFELFRESAMRSDPTFTLSEANIHHVATICHLTQGIPLAIELSASWIRTLPLERMAQEIENNINFLSTRMRNLPERHRSMRAVFTSTWDRISTREREIFTQISIFKGGFAWEIASQLIDVTKDDLNDLLNRSLLRRRSDQRYEIHELLRQYGEELLEESGNRTSLGDQHLRIFLQMAQNSESEIRGPDHSEWMDRLEAESGNCKAALQWSIEQNDIQSFVQLSSSLALYWEVHGNFSEGRYWLERAIALSENSNIEPRLKAKTLRWTGMIATRQGDYGIANEYLQASAKIYEESGDDVGLARVYYILGGLHLETSQYKVSQEYLEKSLPLYQALNQKRGVGDVLNLMALIARHRRTYEESTKLHRASLEIFREIGDRDRQSSVLLNLGYVLQRIDQDEEAIQLISESIEIMKELKNRGKLIRAWEMLAMCLAEQGQFDTARSHYSDALKLAIELGQKFSALLIHMNWSWLEYVCEENTEARHHLERSLRYAEELEGRQHVWWNYSFLALLECREGNFERARQLIKESLENYASSDPGLHIMLFLGLARVLVEERKFSDALKLLGYVELHIKSVRRHAQRDVDECIELTQSHLSENEIRALLDQGASMAFDEVVQYAKGL